MANLFILPPKELLRLFGIESLSTLILNEIKKTLQIDLPFSDKTFKHFMDGKHKPQRNTIDKVCKFIPYMNKERIEGFLFGNDNTKQYWTHWEIIIENINQNNNIEIFPHFRNKFESLVQLERKIIDALQKITTNDEKIKYLFNHPFLHPFLTNDEMKILLEATDYKAHEKIIFLKLNIKVLLYCIAYIDAEYGLDHTDIYGEKFSIVKILLPKFVGDDYINPIKSLFKYWKVKYKKTYRSMAEVISVNTNNKEKLDSQEGKLKQWREGKKKASFTEIKKIINFFESDLDEHHVFLRTLLYSYSYFLSNLFNELLYGKIDGIDIFKGDRELVEWFTANYEHFFDEAYEEIEIINAKGV